MLPDISSLPPKFNVLASPEYTQGIENHEAKCQVEGRPHGKSPLSLPNVAYILPICWVNGKASHVEIVIQS